MPDDPSTSAGRHWVEGWPGIDHEHVFFAHQDPRWLVCDCGQLAQRTRTPHGQFDIRLIDRPTCVAAAQPHIEPTRHRPV